MRTATGYYDAAGNWVAIDPVAMAKRLTGADMTSQESERFLQRHEMMPVDRARQLTGADMDPDAAAAFVNKYDSGISDEHYSPVDRAQELAGAALSPEDAHNFARLHDPRFQYDYAQHSTPSAAKRLDASAAHPAMVAHSKAAMGDAERAHLMAQMDAEDATTKSAYKVSPEELAWRKVQQTTLANEQNRAIADATRHMGSAPRRPAIDDVTAYNKAMFEETLPERASRGIAAQVPPRDSKTQVMLDTYRKMRDENTGAPATQEEGGKEAYGGSALRATLAEQAQAKTRRNAR